MLYITKDELGCNRYMVTNDQGSCLIFTTNGQIANYVEQHSYGIDPGLRLCVGGDPGSRRAQRPLFHHIRQYYR